MAHDRKVVPLLVRISSRTHVVTHAYDYDTAPEPPMATGYALTDTDIARAGIDIDAVCADLDRPKTV